MSAHSRINLFSAWHLLLQPQSKGNCLIISKGNVTIVKEARLVNRQFDYICATGQSLRMMMHQIICSFNMYVVFICSFELIHM